ncbi:MAG: hypothetical protein H7288_22630, partial [Kineosporiaceae bacterium]|nr:hypothetical protein [Aeromicrobium sp.]
MQRTLTRLRKSGALELLAEWHTADNPRTGQGGQPIKIPHAAVLVGLLLMAQENAPLFMRELAYLFQKRLTPESRTLLGLPEKLSNYVTLTSERVKWEKNTNNAFHRIMDLMDPYPVKRYAALTYTQVKIVLDQHDSDRELRMKARLSAFTNAFLQMTFNEQPRRIRRATQKMDVSFDQTFIPPPTKKGFSKKTLDQRVAAEATGHVDRLTPGPTDLYAGWYPRKGDRDDFVRGTIDTTCPGSGKKRNRDLDWGWMLNLAVRVDSEQPGSQRFPQIAVAANLSMPNIGVSEEAIELMRQALN